MSTLTQMPSSAVAASSAFDVADVDADFLAFSDLLSSSDQARLHTARSTFALAVKPHVAEHWNAATFPFEVVPALADLDLVRLALDPTASLLHGMTHVALARVDLSISTFIGVHSILFTGAIATLGSEALQAELLPDLLALRAVGAFALTEPAHGSDISRAMETTATRRGSRWTLRGSKRWIGNGTHANHVLIWARDTADGQIKGFVVARGTPGMTTTPIANKIGLRIVQNADIQLHDVEVDDDRRLSGATAFADTNQLLTSSRAWVAWQTVGLQFAAYEQALRHAREREQFGKPIASFQLVQQQLVRILDNAMASMGVMVRIAQLQERGALRAEHAALAKAGNSGRMRESVALARGLVGGNGIVSDFGVARTFADAEAIYSYEGSYEINSLVVGRAITGISAFA